jgi:hypothetical protein
MKKLSRLTGLLLAGTLILVVLNQCSGPGQAESRPRILVSTDIGGTDPDDNQSMIHLLMYADLFRIEGLISSPYGKGRKENILDMIDLYEQDLGKLREHSGGFPDPDDLRSVCKQGAVAGAPFRGFDSPTEGSDWIIKCARKNSDKPLWVLVWGGLDDLAQALHDAPDIKDRIRVYWIGGPNKKWSVNAYSYVAENHPDLWIIENNATYRGWFLDADSPEEISDKAYYGNFIRGRGMLGKAFKNFYNGTIKMGDTPSLAYLMNGNPDDPAGESWGGSFTRITRSSRVIFDRNTTTSDTVAAYGIMEWRFRGPDSGISGDSACFILDLADQRWPGYYLGQGIYSVRYSSKQPEVRTYLTASAIPELDGQAGQYVSTVPWPGKPGPDDFILGTTWYTDRPEPDLFIGTQQGAKTVSKYRREFLSDWANRWEWLQ